MCRRGDTRLAAPALPGSLARDTLRMLMELASSPPRDALLKKSGG